MSPAELPNWGNNPSEENRNSDSDPQNQIIWEESEDVYKPILKTTRDFQLERGLEPSKFEYVYIKADALDQLKAHLRSNLRIEQGGILFGNAYTDPQQKTTYVEVTAAVPAPATIGTGAHLEFTPESWLRIMDYAKHQHPQENIVGWYHSHPNLTAFMSGTDMRTQQAFFYHPWCLSIVYDPAIEDIGYFLGRSAMRLQQPVIFGRTQGLRSQEQVSLSEQLDSTHSTDVGNTATSSEIPDNLPDQRQDTSRSSLNDNTTDIFDKYLSGVVIILISLILMFFFRLFTGSLTTENSPKSLGKGSMTQTTDDGISGSFGNSQLASKLEAHIVTLPVKEFEHLRDTKLLNVINPGYQIVSGQEVVLLVIKPLEPIKESKQFQLLINSIDIRDHIIGQNNNQIVKDIVSEDIGEFVKTSPNVSGRPKKEIINLPLSQLDQIWIPIFSSNLVTKDNPISQRMVRNIIHIPQEIIYKNTQGSEEKVEIKAILKYYD